MHIKALVFDLDHTLYDRYSTLRSICYLLRRERDAWFPADLYAAKLGDILAETDKRWIYGGWELVHEKLLEQGTFSQAPSPGEFKQEILRLFGLVAVPIPGVIELLASLHTRYSLGLITNGESSLQRKKLRLLGLTDSFDEVIVSGELGCHKPDPKIFHTMCKRLNCPPEQMLYIGDSPKMDVSGAYGAGVTPIWVSTGGIWYFPELKRAPYEIHDVTELPGLLDDITG